MACRLVSAKPLSELVRNIDNGLLTKKTSVKFLSKFIHFQPRKCIWNSRLRNGNHFVPASNISKRMQLYKHIVSHHHILHLMLSHCTPRCLVCMQVSIRTNISYSEWLLYYVTDFLSIFRNDAKKLIQLYLAVASYHFIWFKNRLPVQEVGTASG